LIFSSFQMLCFTSMHAPGGKESRRENFLLELRKN
jgi:hypothetical protein